MPRASEPPQSLFANRDYRRLWLIGLLAGIARWLDFLALGIYAYELTESASLVALVAIFRFAPFVVLGLAVGALADAFDNRRLFISIIGLMLVISAAMSGLAYSGLATYWTVAAAAVFSGLFWLCDMPLRRRLLVDRVGPARMTRALGLDNSTANSTRALGPLIGGGAYELLGIVGIYAVIATLFLICLMTASRLRRRKQQTDGDREPFSIRSMLVPPRELVTSRRLLIVLGVTLVYNLWCFPFVTMIPVIGQKDFGLSPTWVGVLSACEGAGATIGAMMVGLTGTSRNQFVYYFWGPMSFLLLLVGLSLHFTVDASFVTISLLGVASACFSATQYALVYMIAPSEMRGRAAGILTIFIGSATLGFANVGYLFETFGSQRAMQLLALEGIPPLLVLGVLWWRTQGLAGGLIASQPRRGAARTQLRQR